jgi:Zn-dependent metalloprotease
MFAKTHNGLCLIQGEDDYMTTIVLGTSAQRALAFKNMNIAKDLRDQRNMLDFMPSELSLSSGEKSRTIHDVGNRRLVLEDLPGRIRRSEGDKGSGDQAVDDTYSNSGITFDFYQQVFSRNSIDNNFMPLVVHYDRGFDNAFWNEMQMVFGDGGGLSGWPNPMQFLDIMGHELSHGIVNKTANLRYRRQSGALNESFADVMGR